MNTHISNRRREKRRKRVEKEKKRLSSTLIEAQLSPIKVSKVFFSRSPHSIFHLLPASSTPPLFPAKTKFSTFTELTRDPFLASLISQKHKMDIIGTTLAVAQTLTNTLQCYDELGEKLSAFDYEDQRADLQRTVGTLTAVLRDAETKQQLSHQALFHVKRLKDAIFEADDLMDELVTLAQQQRLVDADGSLREKLSHFFSLSNPIYVSYWMSKGIKDVKKTLDAIAYDNQFSFNIDPEPIRNRSRETCSYVNKVEIVGREHDLEKIVGMLLDPNDDQRDVSILSIVGIGGLGKTALAQLVYNDPRVVNAFQLKLWACVSDQDQEQLDVKNILGKILGSPNQEGSTLDRVQSELRARLAGNKYLLILDDVWTEKRDQWRELVKYFSEEKRGSWIVVTTRSKNTATITGGLMHELSGLSKENSWDLFERTAFSLDKPKPTDELVEIGKKIVDGCSGVPLAIKVVGSLLYGQDKSEWLSVQKIGLANKTNFNDGIMPILKLSFYQLEAPLKNCFRYCALFPKDYVIHKPTLIDLWMAQGYIVPRDKNQSIDEAGEEYFSILLKRCFFQDIKHNQFGEIEYCKIHDLMHDIAQNVAGNEMRALDSNEGNVDDNVRHLSISTMGEYEKYCSLGKTNIRSLLSFHCNDNFQLLVGGLVKRFKCLRVLDLSGKGIKHLPESIGELLHLRYIDLSGNHNMEVVPNTITKLCNLQALILNHCSSLKELPKDLHRLVKLRVLEIERCDKLTCMPRGIGKLTCLHTLRGCYPVGGREKCTSWKQWLDELENLKTLINLRDLLRINMKWPRHAKNDVKEDRREGLYLRSMEHVSKIWLLFGDLQGDIDKEKDMEEEEGIRRRVMEDLQPHSNLKILAVVGYDGLKMPSWFTATLLPHLVRLHLIKCEELEYLPCLRNLCHLKCLYLRRLPMLEYIEEEEEHSRMLASTSTAAQKASIFPSLEQLELDDLPKFEGWRRVGVEGMEESAINNNSSSMKPQLQISLPQLVVLEVLNCPEMTCTLLCPVLESLCLGEFNERLEIVIRSTKTEERLREAVIEEEEDAIVPKLRKVDIDIDKGAWLNSMPMESFHTTLQSLIIRDDDEMEDLPNCIQHLSALQSLSIYKCSNLKAMPSWMPKLTSLRELRISRCSKRLKKRCQKDPPGEDWPYIQHIPHII